MISKAIAGMLAAAFLIGTPAQAQVALSLSPVGPWALDYAEDSCRLVRTFGEGEHEVTLGLTAYEPGGQFFISAVGNLTRVAGDPGMVSVLLGSGEAHEVGFLQVDFGGRPGIVVGNPLGVGFAPRGGMERLMSGRPIASFADPAREQQAARIGFVDGFEQEFVAETGSLGAPINALRECAQELVGHWDVDAQVQVSRTRTPTPQTPPHTWLTLGDFPRDLWRPMLINYRLTVDEEGRPVGCHVAAAAAAPELAALTCARLQEQARFSPALGADGEPVRSYFVWQAMFR